MRTRGVLDDDEPSQAAREAGKGALEGAAKWGAAAAALATVGYKMSPVYRGLTIQFKVYIQMSAMIFGGMIYADGRLRQFENQKRLERRVLKERAKWEQLERELADDDDK